jgi:hypothetical protein
MKSPLVSPSGVSKTLSALKELIPPTSVVDSFLFFDGHIELNLLQEGRYIVGHTNKRVIYEFWRCVMEDAARVATIANEIFPFEDEELFHNFQENLLNFNDPYFRSACFFLLNRCSDSALISQGNYVEEKFNPLLLSYLKNFKINNFYMHFDPAENFIESVKAKKDMEYALFPLGKFSYNFFEYGKNKGSDESIIDHAQLHEMFKESATKSIILYNFHPQVLELYKNFNLIMTDKYGHHTSHTEKCEDLIITNF